MMNRNVQVGPICFRTLEMRQMFFKYGFESFFIYFFFKERNFYFTKYMFLILTVKLNYKILK